MRIEDVKNRKVKDEKEDVGVEIMKEQEKEEEEGNAMGWWS